ncbi:MAG: hypothetical protein JSR65_05820 [Proteobacteria bacterium]|nr:hypothetical protein [Pseudomonadota bacterium]
MLDAQHGAFASFEQKWLAANPEQATVALFFAPDARLRAAAFGCLIHELEQAAFGLGEAHVAEVKIQWWRQELLAAASGSPRHPVSAVLFADPRTAKVDATTWTALADGALEMRHVGAGSDLGSLLSSHAVLYTPVAQAEAALFDVSATTIPATAKLWTISHLLLALRHLADAPERLPVPLDLLARHELTRAALAEVTPKRGELVREVLGGLSAVLQRALVEMPCGLLARRVRARLDLALMQNAMRAGDPLRAVMTPPGAARWKALWWSWREARAAARD